MEHKLKCIGERGYDERGDLYAYDTHPSSKLIVPTEGCLEITLTPNARFRYELQFVNISLSSGILTIDNCARDELGQTQLFGFFGKEDVLKFGIRLKTVKEVANAQPDFAIWHESEERKSVGELYIVHGGVINEEDTWEMLSNCYKDGSIGARADWSLHPGFNRLQVFVDNEKEEKVKKLQKIYNEKCDATEKRDKEFFRNMGKKENNEAEKEKSKKVFEKKDWRAENHGLKVVKLTKPVDEEPKKDENEPEKSGKSKKSFSKISKKSEKSKKSESQKSVPKEVVAEVPVSQNPVPKSNRSERAHTPRKSQKSASSVKSLSKETVTKTEITQNTELKSSAEPEKVQKQEKKKKKNPCCSII
ncbi:hypothetical protein CAEBREN_13522 [Caenorhabditis brenneri]|uniref:Uncharacterized protein n=1 Tax=Caenorhabditis brenneri TaxID=135651 RepID=G0MDM1_CAEBE|nr:hypothetical protein CAEBREN_13522 [Caenorhabditis brenneri]